MSTKFDAEAIKAAAGKIGGLMDDMSAFEALKHHWPNAGKFKLAVWLERVVDDRRNAVVAHAEHLKLAFDEMEKKLNGIATNFQNADGDNAQAIGKAISGLEGDVVGAVHTFDGKTEAEQHNYTPDTKPGSNSRPVSDGYSDNLSTPVTT